MSLQGHVRTEPGRLSAPAIPENSGQYRQSWSRARAYRRIADASSEPALFTPAPLAEASRKHRLQSYSLIINGYSSIRDPTMARPFW